MVRNIFLAFMSALLLYAFSASALATDSVEDIPAQTQRVEGYLNSLTTAKARFVQTAHDGTQLTGMFYLSRPGRLRFEYDAPLEDFVVADGFFIYFYDAELGEQTNAPIGQTLADFILRENITLGGDIRVDYIKRGGGYLQAALSQKADPQAGGLFLAFKEEPKTKALRLKKWRVVDGQGLITEVELFDFEAGIEHPQGLFVYRDPKHGLQPNYNN